MTPKDDDAERTLRRLLEEHAPAALGLLARTGAQSAPTSGERLSTEALIKLAGRPALAVRGGHINFDDPLIGQWKEPLVLLKDYIPNLVEPVGRIDVGGTHAGTGFLVADDMVMTNSHVLAAITTPDGLLNARDVTIDFHREQGSAETLEFTVAEVLFAGTPPVNNTVYVDFASLDVALLRIEKSNPLAQVPPRPLSFLAGEMDSHSSRDVFVIGFPARPSSLFTDAFRNVRPDVANALMRIFEFHYGVKYLSPGIVTRLPGGIDGDDSKWVFAHDATTLGGNSGSCVIRCGRRPAVIGLHFAGKFETANYAHALQRVVEGRHLPDDLASRFKWVKE